MLDTQDVKNILRLDHVEFDHYIRSVLPLTIDFVKRHCENDFLIPNPYHEPDNPESPSMVEEFGGAMLGIAKIIEFNMNEAGITADSVGSANTSFTTEIPQSILFMLEPYNNKRKVKFF